MNLTKSIWGRKSSSHPDFLQNDAFWGFAKAYISKCRNITRCRRNMADGAFESFWSILFDPKKIFVIRTHPEELHVLKCLSNTRISTIFSEQWDQQIEKYGSGAFKRTINHVYATSSYVSTLWNICARKSSKKVVFRRIRVSTWLPASYTCPTCLSDESSSRLPFLF